MLKHLVWIIYRTRLIWSQMNEQEARYDALHAEDTKRLPA